MKLFAKIFTAFLFLYANTSTAQLTDIVTKSEMTGAWYNTSRPVQHHPPSRGEHPQESSRTRDIKFAIAYK
jgi:hypothetical protein